MAKVKHVVLMRFPGETPSDSIDEIYADLTALREVLPGMLECSGGAYRSDEGLNQGFTHALSVTFADEQSRDNYLKDARHESLKEKILPLLEGGIDGVIAFDWIE